MLRRASKTGRNGRRDRLLLQEGRRVRNLCHCQIPKLEAHAESLKRCDKLLNEPENYEIENFFDAINITEFGAVITQMQFEHNVILTAQLHHSDR